MRDRERRGTTSEVEPNGDRVPRYVVVATMIVVFGILLFAVALVLALSFTAPLPEAPLGSSSSTLTVAPSAVALVPTPTNPPLRTPARTQTSGSVSPTNEATVVVMQTSTIATAIATLPANEGHITAHPPSSQLELDVEAAYLHYWDVRARALNRLDPIHLQDVESGPELTRDMMQIEDLKSQGRALVIDVTHHVFIVRASATVAEVYDQYDNRGYVIDANTEQRVGSPEPGTEVKTLRLLQSFDGLWKVTDAKIVQ